MIPWRYGTGEFGRNSGAGYCLPGEPLSLLRPTYQLLRRRPWDTGRMLERNQLEQPRERPETATALAALPDGEVFAGGSFGVEWWDGTNWSARLRCQRNRFGDSGVFDGFSLEERLHKPALPQPKISRTGMGPTGRLWDRASMHPLLLSLSVDQMSLQAAHSLMRGPRQ